MKHLIISLSVLVLFTVSAFALEGETPEDWKEYNAFLKQKSTSKVNRVKVLSDKELNHPEHVVKDVGNGRIK